MIQFFIFHYPAAQFPEALPPFSEHSVEVKQVPFRLESVEVHPWLGKVTTENKDKTGKKKKIDT